MKRISTVALAALAIASTFLGAANAEVVDIYQTGENRAVLEFAGYSPPNFDRNWVIPRVFASIRPELFDLPGVSGVEASVEWGSVGLDGTLNAFRPDDPQPPMVVRAEDTIVLPRDDPPFQDYEFVGGDWYAGSNYVVKPFTPTYAMYVRLIPNRVETNNSWIDNPPVDTEGHVRETLMFFDSDIPWGSEGFQFVDVVPRDTFFADIEWLANNGITKGCNPPVNDLFCPDDFVTRAQMATFLDRALDLPSTNVDYFVDDDGSVHEAAINRLAESGITFGCNPAGGNTNFCPESSVTRGQMAAFLVRAFGYTDDGGGDLFVDDNYSIFESNIDKLATAGVTKGCNPPDNTNFCPNDYVTRGQMAAFLHRALGG